jgi:hypothetical protein
MSGSLAQTAEVRGQPEVLESENRSAVHAKAQREAKDAKKRLNGFAPSVFSLRLCVNFFFC